MPANFEHYKIFYYVAKYGNLTRAANALVTSQPSVTYCIQNLEKMLGCKLFIRSRKGVTLTPDGELLYSYVAPACQQILEGEAKLKEHLGEQHEYVNVGATQMAMLSYLVVRLHLFQERYPQVKLNIVNYNTQQTLGELKAGKIDMAIITTPFDSEKSFRVVKVKPFRSVLVGGKEYEKYSKRQMYLSELQELPLITLSGGSTTYSLFQQFYRTCGLTMKPAIEVAALNLILPVILKNLGIGFVPEEFAKPYLDRGEIVEIKLYERIPERSICIVSDTNRPLNAAAQKLQDLLECRDIEEEK